MNGVLVHINIRPQCCYGTSSIRTTCRRIWKYEERKKKHRVKNNNCINLILNERAKTLQFECIEQESGWRWNDEQCSNGSVFFLCGSFDEHLVVIFFVFVSYYYYYHPFFFSFILQISIRNVASKKMYAMREPR